LSEIEKFKRRFLKDGYEFEKPKPTDVGERLIGKKKGKWGIVSDKWIFIEYVSKSATLEDFTNFLKNYEDFVEEHGEDVKGGYFVTHGDYDKKGFNFVLGKLKKGVRERIEIKSLKAIEEKEVELKKEVIEEPKEIVVIKERKPEVKEELPELIRIIKLLEEFEPRKRYEDEEMYEEVISTYLERDFSRQIEHQFRIGSTRVDLKVGKIGIEIKRLTSINELNRLVGQITAYKSFFDHIIVVVFNVGVSKREILSVDDRMKELGLPVTMIIK